MNKKNITVFSIYLTGVLSKRYNLIRLVLIHVHCFVKSEGEHPCFFKDDFVVGKQLEKSSGYTQRSSPPILFLFTV